MTDDPVGGAAQSGSAFRVPEHVVYRSFDAETVVLNLNTGQYHGLNHSAGRMFELLCSSGSLEAAVQQIADEFDQPIDIVARDLAQLCADLAARGLIEVDGSSG